MPTKVKSKAEPEDWTITVTSRKVLRTGVGKHGKWTLYTVKGLDATGEPITESMSTFNRLPIGREIEVTASARNYEDRTGQEQKGWSIQGEHVEADDDIEQKIIDIEGRLALLEGQEDGEDF